jgi:hypothetical protein
MMNSGYRAIVLSALLVSSGYIGSAYAQGENDGADNGGLLQLRSNLDEPRGMCFDTAGFRDSIDYHVPVQAHTCKSDPANREDGLFIVDFPNQGNIFNAAYSLCLDAVSMTERGNVFMRPCTNAASQVFVNDDGGLRPGGLDSSSNALCLSVSTSPSHPSVLLGTIPEPGETFVARTMALAACDSVDNQHKQWVLPIAQSSN